MTLKTVFSVAALVLFTGVSAFGQTDPPTVNVAVDIRPEGCPNPLNVKSKGMLPVAILGTADFDVNNIDPASIRLEDVAPRRSSKGYDVSTPFEPYVGKANADDCTDAGADGFPDLVLKFRTQDIVTVLGSYTRGEVRVLHLTGSLKDGTLIQGEDVVVIKAKKPKKIKK